eukprot:m.164418 g.164418  ORF g.164418 m.164418 type:complete len:549 (-) comp15235_c0_seq5:3287-4933(-)
MSEKPERTMTTLQLIVVGFFWTSGGFYGSEPVMASGPPLYVLALCLAMPLFYSLPTALLSAELATNYPETGGQCVYVTLACGGLLGAHNSWWVFSSTVFDAALYPIYLKDTIATELQQTRNSSKVDDCFGNHCGLWTQEDLVWPEAYYLMEPNSSKVELARDVRLALDYTPIMLIVGITAINLGGVDWLMRFETLLGVMALLPCLVFLGIGFPRIATEPLVDDSGEKNISELISKSLWLYGGFTNLGVLAGEAITPRESYLAAVAVLVPLKILLRFVPFLIAYSVVPDDGGESKDLSSTGYFNVIAEELSGKWLRMWYFIGSLICFVGFYNAMAINAERTAFFFCEERFSEKFHKWSTSGPLGRFLFAMPKHGGIRRIYTLVVAILEIVLVSFLDVSLLIELEMLIYALSAGLFFYSFVYLRLERTRKFASIPGRSETAHLLPDDVSLDKEGDNPNKEIFTIGGGNIVAIALVIFPVAAFGANAYTSITDPGDQFFPYFKLACCGGLVLIGVIVQAVHYMCYGSHHTDYARHMHDNSPTRRRADSLRL